MIYYQQGDVLVQAIDTLPAGLKTLSGKCVQEGEATGHKHQFAPDDCVTVYADAVDGAFNDLNKWVEVRERPATLFHEEHGPIEVPPGVYKLDIVREYDYESNEVRRVVD